MAITNALNAPRNSYTSTAAQTAFTVGFEFYQVSDVKVYKNGSLMTYNAAPSNTVTYSITGTASAGDSAYEFGGGGSVVFGSGLTDGDIVVIVRDIAVERTVDFNPSSAFDITTLNTQLDTIIGMIADREKQGDRSVKLLDTDIVAATVTLPLKATRASKVLSFDADGNTETTITSTGLSTISSITADIVTVAGISSDISAVENIAANVTTVAGISADVTSVAGVSADVTTVAGIASDVSAVENIAANVTTVAGISSNVTTVAGANANISTVVGGLTNINTVAGAVANVNTVASNVAGVTSFAERYRVASSAPSSSLDVGDLYFDTSSDTMKVYGGSGWQNAGSSVNGTAARFIFSVSSSTLTISGNDTAGNTLAYDAGFVDVWLNGVKMVNGTDVTVTSGTSIVFAVAIGTSGTDTVDVIAYGTFNVANVTSSSLENGSVTTAKIADDAVTVDKLADTINAEITANTAKVTNATHTGEVTGATALTIADNVVDEANLKVSNAPTNGYFLSAQSGDTGGLTWASAGGGNTAVAQHEIFTSTGTFTVPAGVTAVLVELVGGGGGSGGAGSTDFMQSTGGGGGGGYSRKYISGLTAGDTIAVTIGAGGTAGGAGSAGGNGGNGGTTSFASHCSATGGTGSIDAGGSPATAGGAGGSGTGGDINLDGGAGGNSVYAYLGGGIDYPQAKITGGGGGSGRVLNSGGSATQGIASGSGITAIMWHEKNGGLFGSGTAGCLLEPFTQNSGGAGRMRLHAETIAGDAATGHGCGAGGASARKNATAAGGAGKSGLLIVQY
jgi:hypothetical protein